MRRLLPFALLLVASSALAQEIPAQRAEILDRVSSVLKTSAFVPGVDLAKWDAIAAESKEKFAAAKTDDEFAREVNAALRKFGQSHFRFMTPRQDETRRTQRTIGLGLTAAPAAGQKAEVGLRVAAVAPGSPADKAGLKAGDVLLKIDGKAPTREALQGEEGKTVRILVKGRKEQELKFAPYSLRRPATLTKVDESTALFRLPTFSTGYDRAEVEKCITEATKYPNLIIDLRNNGGGAVVSMQHLMGLFMPSDSVVGTFVTKPLVTAYGQQPKRAGVTDPVTIANWSRYAPTWSKRQIQPAKREGGPLYKGNVVVLVNRGSASASEIFASAAHDVIGADVVGTRSMGAVLVSVFRPVGGGFSLQYPTSDYVTVSDRRLEANPIVPVVEDPDPQAEIVKATYLLKRAQLRKERFGK
ncbi:PDZ domain-containing protein [bacterium]|nr:MAG: PDZ domain-containing protein [bacterium]